MFTGTFSTIYFEDLVVRLVYGTTRPISIKYNLITSTVACKGQREKYTADNISQ